MKTDPAVLATAPQPGHYDIDPDRSRVTFATRHLFGLGRVKGSFAVRGGRADIADPLEVSAIYAEIDTASFRANGGPRDHSVRSTRIDRTEFGVTAARGLAARYLDLTVEVQCTRN
jgi:polyisoprenoid-binding protein YceI